MAKIIITKRIPKIFEDQLKDSNERLHVADKFSTSERYLQDFNSSLFQSGILVNTPRLNVLFELAQKGQQHS